MNAQVQIEYGVGELMQHGHRLRALDDLDEVLEIVDLHRAGLAWVLR